MHEGLKPNDEALMTTVYTTAAMPSFPIGAQRALKASSWGLCPQRRVKTPWLGFAYARAKVLTLCPPFSPKGRGSGGLNPDIRGRGNPYLPRFTVGLGE